MLSKKMAFSLMSLITVFALVFAVAPAMAELTFTVLKGDTGNEGDANPDVDTTKDGHQLSEVTTDDPPVQQTDPPVIRIKVMADIVLADISTEETIDKIVVLQTVVTTDDPPVTTITEIPDGTITVTITREGPMGFGINFDPAANTKYIDVHIPENTFGTHEAKSLRIEYVGVIQEDAPVEPDNASRPRVVSIQRLRPGSQTAVAAFQEAEVTGSFNVRIVLTENPKSLDLKDDLPGKDGNANKLVKVENGTVSDLSVGTPFKWFGGNGNGQTNANRDDTIIPNPIEGMYQHSGEDALASVPQGSDGFVPLPTDTTDNMYYQYRVKVTPHRRASIVKVSVKAFHDKASANAGETYDNYYQPIDIGDKPNGREELRLTVNIPKHNLEAGYRIYLPHEQGADFPKDGHYILTRNKMGSFINYSHHEGTDTPDRENKAQEQTLAQLKFNVRETVAGTPASRARTADEPQFELPNLEAFLANNGTIHLVSYVRDGANPKYKMGAAYISEVMWGTDASQNPVSLSNWIEIRRVGDKIDVGAQDWALWFYEAHETPPTAYPANSSYEGAIGQPGEIIDIIGTKASDTGRSWGLAGLGQSGRSNVDIARAEQHVLTPTTPLISMYRMVAADGTISDGTQADSWMQTSGPSVNLAPGRENAIVATPGAAPFPTPDTLAADEKAKADAAADEKAKADAAAEKERTTGTYPMAGDGRVYVSEVMFAGGGTLPQWIEIANGDRAKEFNLSGWTITVDNAVGDADVAVSSAKFTIPDGTKISPSAQDDTPSTILVVTERGRNSFDGAMASGQVINLAVDNEIDLINAGILTGKYALLSDMAFLITLAPPVPAATKAPAGETSAAKAQRQAAEKKAAATRKAAMDMAGNLGKDGTAAWALPMNEGGARSSIIRKHIQVTRGPAAPEDGMMAENWALASNTSFAQVTHIRASSYYGAANDVGTPGFRAGGALPVELSHFRPARDKATGAAVITWATESELNNAGFFIKRSQQRNGEFKVINATMVPGAGTTSEKQFYTYTDTTAQPNVVYYYQIEDVSLDGNRQTLTRGIRLRGHVGAAGKATVIWGELKTSHE